MGPRHHASGLSRPNASKVIASGSGPPLELEHVDVLGDAAGLGGLRNRRASVLEIASFATSSYK
jgi:hypothetical protein